MSRQIILGGPPALEARPDLVPQPSPVGSQPLTPQRWREFFAHVRDVRRIQCMARDTMDPVIRKEATRLEDQLDSEMGWLAADLAAADARAAELAGAAEGGGL